MLVKFIKYNIALNFSLRMLNHEVKTTADYEEVAVIDTLKLGFRTGNVTRWTWPDPPR